MTAAQLHNNKIWGMPSIQIVLNMLQFSSLCKTLDDGKIVPGTVLRKEALDRVVKLQQHLFLKCPLPTFENGIFWGNVV